MRKKSRISGACMADLRAARRRGAPDAAHGRQSGLQPRRARGVRGLSFSLSGGEALLVTGRNGAGKSSLLRMIAGLVRLVGRAA